MKTKIFIDGSEGTTGLRINERFQGRDDLELLTIDPALRKDPAERKKLINASDVTILCLPDGPWLGLRVPGAFPGLPEGHPGGEAHCQSRLSRFGVHRPGVSPGAEGNPSGRRSGQQLFPDGLQRRREKDDRPV